MSAAHLERERRTIHAMIAHHCRDRHGRGRGLCDECRALYDYASERLDKCPYGTDKPTCVNCPIHCYQPRMREAARELMRYAGPRMPSRHPILSLAHVIDDRRPVPALPGRRPPPPR